MRYQRLLLCGSPDRPEKPFSPNGIPEISLNLNGPNQNILMKISDITKKMVSNLPSVYEDLMEIATYVYCADQSTARGGNGVQDLGGHWRRDFYFLIAVRNPQFWNQNSVKQALTKLLDFLSDDFYEFYFTQLKDPPKFSDYLEFPDEEVDKIIDEVILFSGGLDSLAGAIEEIFNQKHRVALVSHRSVSKIYSKQKGLIQKIDNRCDQKMTYHVPIWIRKIGWKEADTSQRSRSFLYACIAATVAAMFKKKRIRFYENGVTSINLPIAEQIIGARATRTTHPKAIKGFAKLFTLIQGSEFVVETPFLWKTKTDIVELIDKSGCTDLINDSVSCSHVHTMTKKHTHCGSCSQCIDRRLATVAAGCEKADTWNKYKTDVFVGERSLEGQDIVLTESYIRMMKECADLSDLQFFTKYGEINRAIPYIEGNSDTIAEKLYQLYVKNGKQIKQAQLNSLVVYGEVIVNGDLPDRCMMSQLFGTRVKVQEKRIAFQEERAEKSPYVFQKQGDKWAIRYKNGTIYYLNDIKGLQYIAELISNPNQMLSAISLRDLDSERKVKSEANRASQEIIDNQAIRECRNRLKEIEEELKNALRKNDLSKQGKLQEEKQDILAYISSSTGIGGQLKNFQEEISRARVAVTNAINRAISKVKEYDAEIYTHLNNSIHCGTTIIYKPETEINWIL